MPASAAAEVAKVKDDDARREIAGKIAAGELTRDETVEVVRRETGAKGRGGAKRKASGKGGRKATERVIRTDAGPRVTVEWKRGLDSQTIEAALVEALAKVRAEQGGDSAAA